MAGSQHPGKRALIVAGPTCSGKSALAMDLARRYGGTVINADSMQLYRELPILTARPTPDDEAAVPHALYGVRPAAEAGSVAWWRDAAVAAMTASDCPILCGGTGLYFRALTHGLAELPEPEPAIRAEARALLDELGSPALHARLLALDPATAARLRPSDGQRVARAWEVWRGTGRGLAAWQADPVAPSGWAFATILLDPPRDVLRAAIAARFTAMMRSGALEEVAGLLSLDLDPGLPAMRAHGVQELGAALRGEATLTEAEARTILVTGQYTKRQATWFRHQFKPDPALSHTIHARYAGLEQLSERFLGELDHFVRCSG